MLDIKVSIAGTFDIICLTETHVHDNSNVSLDLKGYQPIIRLDREENHWGGIAIFVSQDIVIKRRIYLERQSIEAIWLDCRMHACFILGRFTTQSGHSQRI